MRIVSLVPSLTETLVTLGLGDALVGRTKFCIHPASVVQHIEQIGGTKNPKVDRIIDLCPDLIIANKEENRKEDVEALIAAGIDVLVTDVSDYDTAIDALLAIGKATNTLAKAQQLKQRIEHDFRQIVPTDKKVCYLIWKDPYMTIGGDTFIHDMLRKCGLKNIYGEDLRYPTIRLEDIADNAPDYIFLSTEPFPFKEKHRQEIERITNVTTRIVDGEYFSWYGSRIVPAITYFLKLLTEI